MSGEPCGVVDMHFKLFGFIKGGSDLAWVFFFDDCHAFCSPKCVCVCVCARTCVCTCVCTRVCVCGEALRTPLPSHTADVIIEEIALPSSRVNMLQDFIFWWRLPFFFSSPGVVVLSLNPAWPARWTHEQCDGQQKDDHAFSAPFTVFRHQAVCPKC